MNPFFTVVIPTYNRADLITKTIDSVLQQSFTDFELLVVDDGSTDNTDEVVQAISDKRITYYKKENGERGATRNYGIHFSKGKYITFIDSDDLYYSDALQNAHHNLINLDLPPCYAQAFEVVDELSGKQMQAPAFLQSLMVNTQLLKGNFLGCIGVFVKNEILQEINFEEDRMFAGTEDWLLWLKLSARYPFHYSNTLCARMIEHQNRSVLSFSEEKLMSRTNGIREKLLADDIFVNRYGAGAINKIYAHMLSYTALHLAMSGKNNRAIKYFSCAVKANFKELMTRRTLGVFKTMLMKIIK